MGIFPLRWSVSAIRQPRTMYPAPVCREQQPAPETLWGRCRLLIKAALCLCDRHPRHPIAPIVGEIPGRPIEPANQVDTDWRAQIDHVVTHQLPIEHCE
jgi:hypothetical protein